MPGLNHSRAKVWEERKPILLGIIDETVPLVKALEAYNRHHGRYPDSLDALVPDCLPRISLPERPDFGIQARHWEYYTPREKPIRWGYKMPFELGLHLPYGFSPYPRSFEYFVYHPIREDSERGVLERLGDWVYIHDHP